MVSDIRCADCGLLGVLDSQTGDFEVMPVGFRKGHAHPITRPWAAFTPFCSALVKEWSESSRGRPDSIRELHRCAEFYQWHPGFTPQEHRQMRLEDMLRQRENARDDAVRKREDERDALVTAREDARDLAANTRHVEQKELLTGNHMRELVVLGLGIAGATIIAAIIEVVFGGGDVSIVVR